MRIAVNGFGRMGRAVLRAVADRAEDIDIVAVNDLATPETLAHLLRHDSTYGPWGPRIESGTDWMSFADTTLRVTALPDPEQLPWRELGVDLVVEATGRFRTRDAAAAHLRAGADRVLITAPGRGVDATIVLGVNDHTFDPVRHRVISNASCTTNCLAPMVRVLHTAFGVEHALMTTVHSYTNDQNLLDGPHKDARRARSAAVNIIPTTTGAAAAVGEVLPELRGRLDGVAVRVPVEDGSLTDLTVELSRSVAADEVNAAFAEAAEHQLRNVLRYSTAPIVSRDIVGDPASCVIDGPLTRARGHLVKVFGWYDNEWGYANRTVDLIRLIADG
ncbi:type I glyceraldehyde-3-phosphate dehydrogenase [Actinokineospora fastidiosa]|uniref:Glyceraldehyde-3-phosphate dehydrogenase n=1 Tax=Actinokineospora fastidiosa TaxID=1816 RepID=A0A918LBN3_9PSEU|nr:type I glyceraldehyde-3-phosphate dehydrogenase [Actinokineospora fastidiosa]GGS28593.1 glyceraldehyde-3-phosphate dehydrogenase [Actinokineospora fastidiosa]